MARLLSEQISLAYGDTTIVESLSISIPDGLVTTIIADAPTNSTRLRSAIDTDAPTADLICVVSAVRRDTSSPLWAVSKNDGDSEVR